MIVSRHNHRPDSLKVNEYTFERVGNFKYLGADINEDANSHEEVKKRLIATNRCYYGLLPLFKSKLLSRKSKVTLYKVLVRPVALYASSTWATTKSDEKKLEVFERKILRKIFEPCLDVTDAEEAIYDRELTDILDILQEMLRESKSGRRMK